MQALVKRFCDQHSLLSQVARMFLLGLLFGVDVRAQQQLPNGTLRVQSQLVVLDVVVTDASGQIVSGLGPDAFHVYENGVEQRIRHLESPQPASQLPPVSTLDRFGRPDWREAALTLLVLDEMDTPFEETAYSREQLAKYLRSQPATLRQPTSLMWLNDAGLQSGADLTTDREALLAALERHKATLPGKLTRGAGVEELSASLSALQQIALSSRGNKGRKQIIWVGRSFPGVDGTMFSQKQRDLLHEAISSTTNLLLQSRAVIYVIDPSINVAEHEQVLSGVDAPGLVTPYAPEDPFSTGFSFMRYVEQTGGKYFYGRNDVHNEIQESIDRGRSFYTLSYVPSATINDAAYRKVDVRMADPSLVVQAKHGYYPQESLSRAAADKALRFDLRESLLSHMNYTGVGLRFRHCERTNIPGRAVCQVDVDNGSLTDSRSLQGESRADVVAAASALNGNADILANKVYTLQLRLPEHPGKLNYTTIPVGIELPANTKSVRIAVQEASGRIGTIDVPPTQLEELLRGR